MIPAWLQIRLWLDDQWRDPSTPARHPPPGWVAAATAIEACRYLRTGCVVEIDFDHDLGPGPSGAIVARYIEKLAFRREISPLSWSIHSANPVGCQNIRLAMESANRFFAGNGADP